MLINVFFTLIETLLFIYSLGVDTEHCYVFIIPQVKKLKSLLVAELLLYVIYIFQIEILLFIYFCDVDIVIYLLHYTYVHTEYC